MVGHTIWYYPSDGSLASMSEGPRLRFNGWVEPIPGLITCPHCEKRIPTRTIREAWVEVPLADGWVAAYRVQVKSGRPVVSEVRVIPDEGDRTLHGEWSHEPRSVPAEGVPGSALRKVRVGDAIRLFKDLERRWEMEFGSEMTERIFHRHGVRPRAEVGRRPGRAGRSDEFYVRWAEAYIDLLAKGSRSPIKDLAAHPPVKIEGFGTSQQGDAQAAVRAIIQEARRRDLLSKPPRGKAGGDLTQAGLELLEALGRADV